MYKYDRYKIQEVTGEDNNIEYHIIGDDDLKPVEVYDNRQDAEEALKFWNQ